MKPRTIKKKTIRLPKGVTLPPCPALSLENVFHAPGQAAAIRFFDVASKSDYLALKEIMAGKHVKKWMDDANHLTRDEYEEWAGTHSNSEFLFAVLDARVPDLHQMQQVRGFIYLYADREEKRRVKRMIKEGYLKPIDGERHCLEVSFALRPLQPGQHTGSGLISSALRQSCLQVHEHLNSSAKPDIQLFAFVDPDNIAAQRTLESAGFVKKGSMKYDWDSEEETWLYILSWRLLHKKIRHTLLENHL